MTTKDFRFDPNIIEPSEQSPMVSTLLSVIEKLTDQLSQQAEALSTQSEKIDELLTEIRQLKKLTKWKQVIHHLFLFIGNEIF